MIKTSLKDRILIPLTLGLFFLLVVFLAGLYWIERNNIERRVERQFKSTENFFYSQLENDAHLFSGLLETIMNDRAIQTGLKTEDRQALLSHTALLFKRISLQYPVTHLYFSNAQRINLLRVHQPGRYGDRIDRITTLRAEKTGKIAYGLELGPMGTLTLRVVAPMILNGKRIGFVELGEEIYHITAKLKKTIGVELIANLHKKFLDRPGWEGGMKMMGRAYDWDRFPEVVLLEQTLPVDAEILTKFFSEGSHTHGAIGEEIYSQNHRYRYRFLAIKDVQSVEVGDMVVMIDVTSQVTNLYSTMRVIALFTVFLGGVLFFLFRFFLVRFENQLTTAQQKIIDLEKTRTRMESEAKFYSVAQSVNDAMISSDASGKINFWNPAAVIMFGYQEEEVLGQPLTMIMPERFREAYLKGMERIQSGGEGRLIGKTSELFGLKKDGTEFSMELSLAQWEAGNKIFFTGLIRDISQRKQAEEELKRNHDIQKVINALLSLSLQDISLQETLERSLQLILSIPWLAFEAKGSIFIIEKEPEILILKSQQGLAEPLWIACAQVPFGKCLCGRAARNGKIEYANCIDDRHDISYEGMRPHGHYCVPIVYLEQVLGVLNLYIREGYVAQFYIEEFLIAYANTLAGIIMRKRTEEELHQTMTNLRKAMEGVIKVTAATVEARDPSTSGHQQRVSELARAIAQEMGLPAEQVDGIRLAAVIHDLGKISVPAEILSKHTKLSDIEFGLIKAHPQKGYDILKDIEFVWPISRMVWEHHERMDGSGYPRGLRGEEILLESRILAVADVVEAIASHRPYRPAYGIEKALEEISKNKGLLYDPDVVDACLILFSEKGFRFD